MGLAATTDVDLGHQKFRGWAFTNLCTTLSGYPTPPLYCKHDEFTPVGIIKRLGYDARGNLTIPAETVTTCLSFGRLFCWRARARI